MFLDNDDDLYHPFWVHFLQDIIASRKHEDNVVDKAFYCCGKLLIDVVKVNAEFGEGGYDVIQYDQFVTYDDRLNGLFDVAASAKENEEMDVKEYFDFCVKTEILQQFLDVTPDAILSHPFCDVRFADSLSHPRTAWHYDHPVQEWLLMHYSIRQHD